MEAAGVVESVGEGVTHVKPGDRVAYAGRPTGAYAQVRTMPADILVRLPDAIDFETGAAMMLKGLTAQYLLRKCKPVEGLEAGDHVVGWDGADERGRTVAPGVYFYRLAARDRIEVRKLVRVGG